MSHREKAALQVFLLLAGVAMVCFGVWRGESAAVRERVSKLSAPQVNITSRCVNCRSVRLRMRASSSAR